jgi:hypothetical protein
MNGPMGVRTFTTDASGMYELNDLPPGDYVLQLLIQNGQVSGEFSQEAQEKIHLTSGELVEKDFDEYWDGRIEGHIRDEDGNPANVWVALLRVDGNRMPGFVRSFLQTKDDGSYQMGRIPPGRYILMVDPNGPWDGWPYAPQYYPTGVRSEGAKVLVLGQGQQITGIDLKVHRLVQRTIRVRVAWSNGSAAAGVAACAAYENTDSYENKETCTSNSVNTDQNGLAILHVYGESRLRLSAETVIYGPKDTAYYASEPVDAEVGMLPEHVDLVLTKKK